MMVSQILLLVPSFFFLILSIGKYLLKRQEIISFYLNIILAIIGILTVLIFIFEIINYYPFTDLLILSNLIYFFLQDIFLFSSFAILIYSIRYKVKDTIELNKPPRLTTRKGDILLGKILIANKKKRNFKLSLEDLEKHMFICGATGTGKSNFVQYFLLNFKKIYNIPFMLVEFKQEYNFLKKHIKNLRVLKPGNNFSVNIFDPQGANPWIHAERIFEILKSGQFLDEKSEYSPQMEKVLVEILVDVCKNEDYRNWEGFYHICDLYQDNKRNEIPMLQQTLISIKNRIRRFSKGPLKLIFSPKYQVNVKEMLSEDVLIDLSSIIKLGGDKEDSLFFLNMILKYLWDKNISQGAKKDEGINHITIIEDAQYFAPKDLGKQSKISSYLEDIALLQRGTGECLISIATRPQVSEEILANCGVLVIFKNYMEREFQSNLLNLKSDQTEFISLLKKGECLIRVNSVKRPFSLKIPKVKRS